MVSNLAFSPALVGQLGFYARRLKKEELTRRLGLVFTALALVVQSLTVFTPPESANAANGSDFISGGVQSKADILRAYDNAKSDFKDIMDYNGITRAELADVVDKSINSKQFGTGEGSVKTWGRRHVFSAAQGEVKHVIPRQPEGGTSVVYSKPLWRYDSTAYTIANGSTYAAFVGHSKTRGWFAIAKDCGNLITQTTPHPDVHANFISANCEMIKGKAIDGRDKNARIKVFLYYGGPPGKGEKSDPILTSSSDNKFAVKVPEKYRTKATPTKVWGVMIPLAGWHESTVQFEDTVTIPGGCVKPQPSARCESLTRQRISRTEFEFTGTSVLENGATASRYDFIVHNAAGTKVAEKQVSSSAQQAKSGVMSLTETGKYTVRLKVQTSAGEKTSPDCVLNVSVAAPLTPAVEIKKDVDGVKLKEVPVGQDFSYNITVTNTGQVDLKNVLVTDKPQAGVTLTGKLVGTISGNVWSYTIPSLAVGESKSFKLTARVDAYVAGELNNSACVNASEVNPSNPTATDDCDEAKVTVTPPVAMIQVCDLASKTIITIKETDFDGSKYSRNLDDCKKPCDANDQSCISVTQSKTAKNLTQNVDATSVAAQASDRIEYTIYLENVGSVNATQNVTEDLTDVLEYADLTQNGGGTFDANSHVLSWGDVALKPGEKASYSFVVTLKSTIPTMARGQSDPSSYDCIMLNAFGNTVKIDVACTAPKIVEQTIEELPSTGPGENMLFAGVVGSIVTFFYTRSRQLGKEVRLIRKDFNMGTI